MKTHLRLLPHSMLLVSLSLTGCGKKQTNQASTKVVGSGKPSEDNEIPDGYLDQKRVSFQDSVVLQSEIADVEIANETIPDAIIGIKKFDREIFESSNKFITIGPAVEIEAQKEGDLLDTTLVQKDFRVTLKQIKMFPASLIIVLRIDLSNPDRIMVIENKDIEINLDKSLISFLTRKVNSAYVAAVRSPSLQEFKNLTALAIDSVSVELVSNLGGCQVGIFGHNFTAGDKAYIGGQPCSKTEFVSPSEILCTVPNISNVVGSSDIIIIGSSGVMHLGKNVIELAAPVNICDQGSWDGTCTITSDHGEIENHSVLGGPGNLEIVGEGTFKTAALEKIHLCMGGDITISSKVFANFAHLQGHKITIAESGEINVSGLGGKGGPYGAENDALNVPDQTSAPGQGGAGGGGGGHYGNGGRGFQADVSIFTSHGGSPSYGSPEQPTYFGSGGGGMFFGCGSGGDGGGIVKLVAQGDLVLDGKILAKGTFKNDSAIEERSLDQRGGGGGGAGGSIWIDVAGTFSGQETGVVNASGGNGTRCDEGSGEIYCGGGGGGGVIAFHGEANLFMGSASILGGQADRLFGCQAEHGQPGQIMGM